MLINHSRKKNQISCLVLAVLISELNRKKYKILWQVKQLTCSYLLCIFSCCLEFSFNIFIGIILFLLLFSKVGFHFNAATNNKATQAKKFEICQLFRIHQASPQN